LVLNNTPVYAACAGENFPVRRNFSLQDDVRTDWLRFVVNVLMSGHRFGKLQRNGKKVVSNEFAGKEL